MLRTHKPIPAYSPPAPFHYVKAKVAKENPVYWQLVQSALAANPHAKIKEPNNLIAADMAITLRQGNWLGVDFQDKDFCRNLFKAFRLREIKEVEDLVTAWALYEAKNTFASTIRQFDFSDTKGPYQIEHIAYANAENKKEFHAALQKLPAHQRVYFAMDVNRSHEVALLMEWLYFSQLKKEEFSFKLRQVLMSYVLRSRAPESTQKMLFQAINQNKTDVLMKFIQSSEPHLMHHLKHDDNQAYFDNRKKGIYIPERESMWFMANILALDEQLPNIEISPHYDRNNAYSPLISLILPTAKAFSLLESVLHGAHSTEPYYMVGESPLDLMRSLDEKPEQHGQTSSSRPVEITHPDLARSKLVHGAKTDNFMVFWHDLFHSWRNGANILKPFLRHLRTHLANETGYSQSKTIWQLTNMDVGYGHQIRKTFKNQAFSAENPEAFKMQVNFICFAVGIAGKDFWQGENDYSINILLLLDMHQNPETWAKLSLLNQSPESFFVKKNLHLKPEEKFEDFEKMSASIKQIVSEEKDTNPQKSAIYFILRYKLRDLAQGKALCEEIERVGVKQFFHWSRNDGLFLSQSSLNKARSIDTLSAEKLYVFLKFNLLQRENRPKNSFFFNSCKDNQSFLKFEIDGQIRKYYSELVIDPQDTVKRDKFDALIEVLRALNNNESGSKLLALIEKVSLNKNVTKGFLTQTTEILLDKVRYHASSLVAREEALPSSPSLTQ